MKNIKKGLILSAFLLSISVSLQAQLESAHWYFGRNVGLNFLDRQTVVSNKGVAVEGIPKIETSPLNTHEGCFSLSDAQGNLIVASDGMKVYNKNKTLIASNLNGHSSSVQSGILIPYPGHPDKYLIISNKQSAIGVGGIFYSVFDANGNGGNGTVTNINTPFQQTLVDPNYLYENVTSQIHANGKDYWVLNRTASHFFAWLITESGVSTTPVVSNVGGSAVLSSRSEGYLKLSPDGSKLAHCFITIPNKEWMVADFDNATGKVSNVIFKYNNLIDGYAPYGLEFSPNGKNLFVTGVLRGIYVIEVDKIKTTELKLLTDQLSTVQTGFDRRLYSILSNTRQFGIIPNPDAPINEIEYHVFNNYLPYDAGLGLPSFAANWFAVKGDDAVCMDKEAEFQTSISGGNVAYIAWIFGDGSEIVKQDTSPGISTYTQKHKFSHPGHYTIKIRFYNSSDELQRELTTEINISSCILPVNPNIHHQYKQ